MVSEHDKGDHEPTVEERARRLAKVICDTAWKSSRP